jgi:calcineurin-like phosphoesterase family protein
MKLGNPLKASVLLACAIFALIDSYSQTRIISFGSNWKYLDNDTRPTNWETSAFDDAAWASGNGELGFGDVDQTTVINGGPSGARFMTTYFRKSFAIANPSAFATYNLSVERDDGVVVYVNGVEVGRNNMPAGPVTHATAASLNIEDSIVIINVPSSAFVAGTNVIAVEVHQQNNNSSDLSFDLEMEGASAQNLVNLGSSWRYFDDDSRPTNWQNSNFADGLWPIGNAELGFGESDEATVIDGGPEGDRTWTIYFRKLIVVANPNAFQTYSFKVHRDDGFVLYLNGTEVGRNNMPNGTINHTTAASSNVEEEIITFTIPASRLLTGVNVIAVEMHQSNTNSTDLSFNLSLTGNAGSTGLFNFGSAWKYLDNNTRPSGWETPAFNDAAWASGNGELGYGDADETTTVSYGGDAANKYITTYFRKTFNLADVGVYSSFTMNVERDDGVVIYVNGVEVARNNMPGGVIGHSTFASAVEDDEIVNFTIPGYLFFEGTNVIAVEVHQINLGSSDLSFDMELIGNTSEHIFINANSSWRYLDNNTRPTNWDDSGFDDGLWKIGYGELGYGDGDEETLIEDGPDANRYITHYFRKTIDIPNPSAYLNFTFSVKRDDGFVLYVNGTEVSRNNMPAGTVTHSTLASSGVEDQEIIVTIPSSAFVAGRNVIAVEMHNNSITSSDISFDLQLYGNFGPQPIIAYSASWKYLDNDTRPAGWETTGFNDASWSLGNAELGYGDGDEATVVSYGPNSSAKYITTYFRKTVNISNPNQYGSILINLIRDDGAVVYVNGIEVVRSNMPSTTITHSTLASSNIGGAEETTVNTYAIPTTFFVNGNNVIAVEIHQDLVTSTDISFRLEMVGSGTPIESPPLFEYSSTWKYLDNGTDQGTAWQSPAFDDALWSSGLAEFGYGDGDEATVVSYGPDANNKYITTYFRKTFNITNLASYESFRLNAIRDDGIVIYVNGVEVGRDNLPAGAINYLTTASSTIGNEAETTPVVFNLSTSYFVEGANTIAVEIHQRANGTDISTDLSFRMEMVGAQGGESSTLLTRGAYLQMGNQSDLTIRWRTSTPTDSRVELGTSFGSYPIVFNDAALTTEHAIRVNDLIPDFKYYYRIGSSTQVMQATAENFFTTVPPAGARKVRIAAFGDCGRNDNSFQSQTLLRYQNFLSANGIDAADAWLLLGDNAYNDGTDNEYSTGFFSPYGSSILRNHKLYPSPGNHDYANNAARQDDHSIPYYSIFTMPTNGECGGVPSGTEAYYSFDIGDVHFLSLDSYGEETNTRLYDTLGAQVTWIKSDLAANTKRWVVAYWHHPPYTKGSHNSDTEGELISMRENFIRILERYGVDLVICGHSHNYERSYLLKGYFKTNPGDPQMNEINFNDQLHTASNSSAKYDNSANSCPYMYKSGQNSHGTVYVVAGSAGADGGVQAGYPHNALPFAQDDGGMFFFEVDSNRLDAKFIRRDGIIADQFTMFQDVNKKDTFFIVVGDNLSFNASWKGNYVWNTAETTQGVNVTPSEGKTDYWVRDNFQCIADTFTVYANVCSGSINTWVGHTDLEWENAANWSCGTVPTETSDVVIPPGVPFMPRTNTNIKVHSLTVKPGATVTVKSGTTLQVMNLP